MNPNLPYQFAAQLRKNPSFFEDIDEALLCDIVFCHAQGQLSEDDAAEVETLLRTNVKAQVIRQRIDDANNFASSERGRNELNALLDHVLPRKDIPYRGNSSPKVTSRFKAFSMLLSDFFSTNLKTSEGLAGDTLTVQNFSNPEGYPLENPHSEMRLFVNLRVHNGTTTVIFALKLPAGMPSATVRWERCYSDNATPPEVSIIDFTSSNHRFEIPEMKRPDGSERWSFEWFQKGGSQ